MPYDTPLPAEGTDPWYQPLVVGFIGGLRDFVNTLEGVVNGKASTQALSDGLATKASATDLDNVFTVATEAQADAAQAIADAAAANTNASGRVPTARTVAGYALSANVPKAAIGTTGLLEAQIVENGGSTAGIPAGTIIFEVGL